MLRYALVRNAGSRSSAEAYLPANFRVIFEDAECVYGRRNIDGSVPTEARPSLVFVIEGRDDHGWGLDSYVIPRYASGLIACEEIDLSHPIMKRVPA